MDIITDPTEYLITIKEKYEESYYIIINYKYKIDWEKIWLKYKNLESKFALFIKGLMYYYGLFVKKDHIMAKKILMKCDNFILAQCKLGLLYADYNLIKSMKFLEKCKDYPLALYYLGYIYENNHFIRNIDKMKNYYNKLIELNFPLGYTAMGIYYLNINNIEEAERLFLKGKELNNKDAFYYLNIIYSEEKYNKINYEKIIELCLESIEKFSDPRCMKSLGIYYCNIFNYEEAVKYLELALLIKENSDVYTILGDIYLYKTDKFKNIKKGIQYLNKAIELNNINAHYILIEYYFDSNNPIELNNVLLLYNKITILDNLSHLDTIDINNKIKTVKNKIHKLLFSS